MYALINVCYLERNKQLFICSSDSSLILIILISLINLALSETHVVSHDNVNLMINRVSFAVAFRCSRFIHVIEKSDNEYVK